MNTFIVYHEEKSNRVSFFEENTTIDNQILIL